MHLSPTFTNGFGIFSVKGLNRSPLPPAINTASIGSRDLWVRRLNTSIICFSLSNTGITQIPSSRNLCKLLSVFLSVPRIYLKLVFIASHILPFTEPPFIR